MIKIVAISDTHEKFHPAEEMPEADLLIHCGDFTNQGRIDKVERFAAWLSSVADKYNKMIILAGNHDLTFDEPGTSRGLARLRAFGPSNIIYLNHSQYIFNDTVIFGSPFTPRFHDWAFNIERGQALANKWKDIPTNTHVLITHGPPYGILDPGRDEEHVGCKDLAARIAVVQPKLHLFGHCHSGYGRVSLGKTLYINASSCDEMHNLVNKPQVISI